MPIPSRWCDQALGIGRCRRFQGIASRHRNASNDTISNTTASSCMVQTRSVAVFASAASSCLVFFIRRLCRDVLAAEPVDLGHEALDETR